VRVKTVQVAIRDPVYADSLRSLLLQDARRVVQLVETPDLSLDGVIILDPARLSAIPVLGNEQKRLIVMASRDRDDLAGIWDQGVRHLLFDGDPVEAARAMIFDLELSLFAHWV
jgi:hypothetical protein